MNTKLEKKSQHTHIHVRMQYIAQRPPVLSSRHLNVLRVFPLSNPDHPEKLVDVIARVPNHTAKDDEDIVHSQ